MSNKRTQCQHSASYEICVKGNWVCGWCQLEEIERLRAALAELQRVGECNQKLMAQNGDLMIERDACRQLLREACEMNDAAMRGEPVHLPIEDWLSRAQKEVGGE